MNMYTKPSTTSPLKLFQQIGRAIRKSSSPEEMLQDAVDALGWQFNLDRCVALLMDQHELKVKAEYFQDSLKPVGKRSYQLLTGSEMYKLLSEGRPIPLTEIQSETSTTVDQRELTDFIKDSSSKSVVACPL